MGTKACTIVLSIALIQIFLASAIEAFNITRLLSQYPNFSNFSELLTKSNLVQAINGRQTVTVLALDNDAVSAIIGKSQDVLRRTLMVHIALDYYDLLKLQRMPAKSAILTNLFQTSGQAMYRQGFLNVTVTSDNRILFGSAMKAAPLNSMVVQEVADRPYNISVVQVSEPIYVPGLDPSATVPPPSKAPVPNNTAPEAPSPSKEDVPADGPADEDYEGPSSSPGPSPAPAPGPNAPVSSPAAADGGDEDDAPSAEKSGSSRTQLKRLLGLGVAMGFVSCFVAL